MTNDPTTAPHPKAHAEAEPAATPFAGHKPKRTLGLWAVDAFIYPIVNNFGVFSISLFATYLTEHGWPKAASGKALGPIRQWVGDVFQKRGKWLDDKFTALLGTRKLAEMARMVTFSFIDGTFIAPFVKLLEDRREKMAMGIDSMLGTKPDDERVYEAEPKQSWRSVIEGRGLTSLIVVPTAALLSLETKSGNKFLKLAPGESLNDLMFNNAGAKRGAYIEANLPKLKTRVESVLGKLHWPFFMKTTYFEAFYTSVCTGGLYLISRMVARKHPKPEHEAAAAPVTATSTRDEAPRPVAAADTPEKPAPTIRTPIHAERMATPEREAAFV